MIRVEAIYIEEFRGIRKLSLPLAGRNFCIQGPNGSGKSGVVDAIEFALTGDISRLSGEGTAGLSVARHGAHVDKRDDLGTAFVRLDLTIVASGKPVTVTRGLKKPKDLQIDPDDEDVRSVLERVALHKEITLSRREIIKFILTKATDRSRDVQTLLKLDEIDDIRSVLKTTANRLSREYDAARSQVSSAGDDLRRHLDVPELSVDALRDAVNKRRRLLDLPAIERIEANTSVSEGVSEGGESGGSGLHRDSALRDLKALSEALTAGIDRRARDQAAQVVRDVERLETEPGLLAALKKRGFIEAGVGFIEGPACPLCDEAWDEEALRAHLQAKLDQSTRAEAVQTSLLSAGAAVRNEAVRARDQIAKAIQVATKLAAVDAGGTLSSWDEKLKSLQEGLSTIDGIVSVKEVLAEGWGVPPDGLPATLEKLRESVTAIPDETATAEARKFLIVADERLGKSREARRREAKCARASKAANAAYSAYCKASEKVLTTLYADVEADFARFYRAVNREDEGEFEAALSPSESKLDLEVDFYKRGKFPPGAYHSEGHQDGMGLCLYLALMKRVLGDDFRLAVLDDVVMSVDKDHRREFCKLLGEEFPNTQFVITTHDKTWAKQMTAAKLVGSKSAVAFRGWKVEAGPQVHEIAGVWDEIAADLDKDKVSSAAATLRRHLEFVFRELADELAAPIRYRSDDGWDLGDLFPGVLSRYKVLLGKAAKSAQDWKDDEGAEQIKARKAAQATKAEACGGEQWMINRAIHYNEWADLSPGEFQEVVDAFRSFLEELRCATCNAWLRVVPKKLDSETLRCDCGEVTLNLLSK